MIIVYGIKGCGNCTRLKNLLKKYDIKYKYVEIDGNGEKPQIEYQTNIRSSQWFIGYKECKDFIFNIWLNIEYANHNL